jgi:hypothetical protein
MKKKTVRWKPKRVLRLPDLDHAKTAVLNTLGSPDSERSYRFAIDDFIAWYCSEPRLAFNKTVVLRYRLQLEARRLSASTINVRLCGKPTTPVPKEWFHTRDIVAYQRNLFYVLPGLLREPFDTSTGRCPFGQAFLSRSFRHSSFFKTQTRPSIVGVCIFKVW